MAFPLIPLILGTAGVLGVDKAQRNRRQRAQTTAENELGRASADLVRGAGLPIGPRTDTNPEQQQQLGAIARNAASPFGDIRQQAFGQLNRLTPEGQAEIATAQFNASNLLAAKGQQDIVNANAVRNRIFTDEKQLRNTYNARMTPVVATMQKVDQATELAELEGNPLAALNVMRTWIQQMDASMITNPEIASFLDQFGVAGQWSQLKAFFSGEGKLSPQMAAQAVESMKAVAGVMQQYGEQVSNDMGQLVESYNQEATGLGSNILLDPSRVMKLSGFNPGMDLAPVQLPGVTGPVAPGANDIDQDRFEVIE